MVSPFAFLPARWESDQLSIRPSWYSIEPFRSPLLAFQQPSPTNLYQLSKSNQQQHTLVAVTVTVLVWLVPLVQLTSFQV